MIAIIRDQYYVLAPNQIIVFDVTTWGWITLIWGIVVALAGFGLLSGAPSWMMKLRLPAMIANQRAQPRRAEALTGS